MQRDFFIDFSKLQEGRFNWCCHEFIKPTIEPPCPHYIIVDQYHRMLPALPKVKYYRGEHVKYVDQYWTKWMEAFCGDVEKTLNQLFKFYNYIRTRDFLMGRPCKYRKTFKQANFLFLFKNEGEILSGKFKNDNEF